MALPPEPYVVLSPHPDDAALSLGGLLAGSGNARVLTIFDGDPGRERAGFRAGLASGGERRREEAAALRVLGACGNSLLYEDAIDRVDSQGAYLYPRMKDLFGEPAAADSVLVRRVLDEVRGVLGDGTALAPLGVGRHVDHVLAARVGRQLLAEGASVLFYAEAPYVWSDTGGRLPGDSALEAARRLGVALHEEHRALVDTEVKHRAVCCYRSQIEALFGSEDDYRRLSALHYEELGGAFECFYRAAKCA